MISYEFAILRYMHDAFAGELVNVGVVMWIPAEHRIRFHLSERYSRLSGLYPGFDGTSYRQLIRDLAARLRDIRGEISGEGEPSLFGSISGLSDVLPKVLPEGTHCFRWSDPFGGIASEPAVRLDQIVQEVVERASPAPRSRRGNEEIWSAVQERLATEGLLPRVRRSVTVEAPNYTYRFHAGWRNSKPQFAEPISLDYLDRSTILDTAATWSGRLFNLSQGNDFQVTGIVAPPELRELNEAYKKALAMLRKSPCMRRVMAEDQLDELVQEIRSDLETHPSQDSV